MRLILACVFACLAGATTALADTAIEYSVSPVMTGPNLTALAITVRLDGEDDGDTVLNLPNEWGGKTKLYESIRDLRIAGGDLIAQPDPAKRLVHHRPKAKLFISYKIVQTWPGEPKADGANEYRPIIQPRYFQVLGNAIFITPERDDHPSAKFSIAGLPAGWSFASDLEHGAMGRKLVLDDIVESVLVGGDFRVLTRGKVRLAIRGKWSFTDEDLIGRLQPIIESHQRFWGDPAEPFLVTALPLKYDPGAMSLGGTGRGDAFVFFATDNAESARLNKILAHEHLHTWIPARIGAMPKDDEAKDYWLSEGFTEFYTARLLVRDGLWSLKDYVDALNEMLLDYATSKVRAAPNAKIVTDFWKDPETEQLPYQRGQLLANVWDQRLRLISDGARDLDDVVLAMKARVKAMAGEEPPLATVLFAEEAGKLGLDVSADVARFVTAGAPVLLDADIFQPCGKVETADLAEFDRGFDAEKTAENGNVIVGLRDDGPGYRAGLRNGMKIIKRETGKPGDSRVALTYRVMDGGRERVITFMPEGTRRITLQELKLAADLDDATTKLCVARLSGLPGRYDDGVWGKVKKWIPF
jgi:predicted metalloprotease with PDZ domain